MGWDNGTELNSTSCMGMIWQPIDHSGSFLPSRFGWKPGQVMYGSGLSADSASLNHRDPFMPSIGLRVAAIGKWAVGRPLREVGLTVDIFCLPVSIWGKLRTWDFIDYCYWMHNRCGPLSHTRSRMHCTATRCLLLASKLDLKTGQICDRHFQQ